ncbi:DUF4132 domain-containing protein [Streptomyces sp. NPDC005012]|uniref:DUF4132 domain-containing protein n=1 Tax=Streptomyces sp. NPDC005012 TaxID=3154558 RepID=UPI0033A4DC8F
MTVREQLAAEDLFEMPAAWRRAVPAPLRRGGTARPSAEAPARISRQLSDEAGWIGRMLNAPQSDPGLVAAARAYVDGDHNPLGAAVFTRIAFHYQLQSLFVDFWVLQHGLPFAARTLVEMTAVEAHYRQAGQVRGNPELRRTAPDAPNLSWLRGGMADRLRLLIAAADEETYRRTREELASCCDTAARRILAAHLMPDEREWIDACCVAPLPAGAELRLMLLSLVYRPDQLDCFEGEAGLQWSGWSAQLVATLADRVGPAFAPLLAERFGRWHDAERYRTTAGWLLELPTDEAFALLLQRADDRAVRPTLLEAMRRYPLRALRLLSAAVTAADKDKDEAALLQQLLTSHVVSHAALVREALPDLPEGTAALVTPLLEGLPGRVADAPAEALPDVLVSPPWMRERKRAKPRSAEPGADPEPELHWADKEQEAWAAANSQRAAWHARWRPDYAWKSEIEGLRRGESPHRAWDAHLFVVCPEDVVRPLLSAFDPEDLWDGETYLKPVAARHGLHALPMLLRVSARHPATLGPLLLPYRSVEVARRMADWLTRLKSTAAVARTWLQRHGEAAAPLLAPDAVGRAGKARAAAEHALRLLAGQLGTETVVGRVAAVHGEEVAGVVAETLAADPLVNALPAKMPAPCAWADPALLPQLLLADGGGALPADAVRHAVTMLQLSKPGDPYPGVRLLQEHCEARSLAEFAWALFEAWRFNGMPAQDTWALHALGMLGDDDTVRRLTPVIRAWPGESAHHRAVEGLAVLAAIGTDAALAHLHGISQRVPFKALKKRAQEKIEEVAEGLGLTGEQLADRLVPDLGLSADGSTVIDYGPRRFTVGFDEQLRPYVLDGDGKRRKALPAPGVKDDPELAPAERKRFAALKKEVRTLASDQVRRLEAAMVSGRSWTAAEFRELLVGHPLVWHLVRRLVWLADHDGATTAFRVAEDRTFADVHDDEWTLHDGADVRLAHPLHLGADLEAWAELFADYEILQPFPQLGRPVHTLTEEEAGGHRLTRFEGVTVQVGKLLGLTKRGWERGNPEDNGVERWISKRLPGDRFLVIQLEEGIAVGMVDEFPDQPLGEVWLDDVPGDYRGFDPHTLRLGDVDAVTASEFLADLTQLTEK